MKNIIFILMFSLLLGGCTDDETPVTAITIVTKKANQWKIIESHAFISDDKGNVLDVSVMEDNSTVILKAPAGMQHINVTFFYVWPDGRDFYHFSTYTNVPVGKTLYVDRSSSEEPPSIGTTSIKIPDFTEHEYPWYAVRISPLRTLDLSLSGTTLDATLSLTETPQEALIIGYRNGLPVHKKINDLTPGIEVTLSYNDFQETEHLLQIPDGAHGEIFADGLVLSDSQLNLNAGPGANVLGYIDGFATYFTRFSKIRNGYYYYEKQGSPATSITLPNFIVNNLDIDPEHFQVDINEKYIYSTGKWFNDLTDWNVAAPAGKTVRIPEIPREIKNKYADVSKENFQFIALDIVTYNNVSSYSEVVEFLFSEQTGPFERVTCTINP